MPRVERWPLRSLRWCAAAAVLLFAGCSTDLSSSTTTLLVPDDPVYLDTFQFEPVDGLDNFRFFSNWSPSFDPAVDRSRMVVGYQVSDPASWTGTESDETPALARAFRSVVADLRAPETEACGPLGPGNVRRCVYEVGQSEPLALTGRVIDTPTGPAVIFALGDGDAVRDYVRGTFTGFRPVDAVQWQR